MTFRSDLGRTMNWTNGQKDTPDKYLITKKCQ